MSAYTHPVPRAVPQAVRQLVWFASSAPSRSSSRISACRCSTCSTTSSTWSTSLSRSPLLASYVRVEQVDVAEVFRCRWRWSLGLGVVLAVFLVFNVFNTEDATARPHGAYFVFELLWRGVGYGLVDTLLLTVFPCLRRLPAPAWARRRPKRQAPVHGADAAARDHRHGDLPPGLPPVSPGRPQSPRDREHPDLDPDVRHRKPRRLDRRARSQHVAAVTHAYESKIFVPPVTKA